MQNPTPSMPRSRCAAAPDDIAGWFLILGDLAGDLKRVLGKIDTAAPSAIRGHRREVAEIVDGMLQILEVLAEVIVSPRRTRFPLDKQVADASTLSLLARHLGRFLRCDPDRPGWAATVRDRVNEAAEIVGRFASAYPRGKAVWDVPGEPSSAWYALFKESW